MILKFEKLVLQKKALVVTAFVFASIFIHLVAFAEDKLPFPVSTDYRDLPTTALIETNKGPIEIRFYRNEAPITVKNFEYLGLKNYYKDLTFHRHLPGFVIQGGDPKGDGSGGPGYSLPPEFSKIPHMRGTVGMARFDDEVNVERRSNGSQFYICFDESPHLDGLYTVFAEVISGIENAEDLRPGDKITGVRFPKNK